MKRLKLNILDPGVRRSMRPAISYWPHGCDLAKSVQVESFDVLAADLAPCAPADSGEIDIKATTDSANSVRWCPRTEIGISCCSSWVAVQGYANPAWQIFGKHHMGKAQNLRIDRGCDNNCEELRRADE